MRAVEFYKGKLIAYSLGNFCTYSRFNLSGPNALAPVLQVWLDEKGDYLKAQIIPSIRLVKEGLLLIPNTGP